MKQTVFRNRGIEDYKDFESTCDNWESQFPYSWLDNMDRAVECLDKHINARSRIHIVVDCDTDGYTSSSAMFNYIRDHDRIADLSYSIHQGKEHGLSEDIAVPEGTELLIVPDAGSGDVEQCKLLVNKGVEIIILDHHECEIINPYAIVVNNQMCDYPNKQLSGVGVVYKFMQAFDDEKWTNFADKYLDLVSLGLIADNMDVTSIETKYLIDSGLKRPRNKFFKALIKKQSYILGDHYSAKDIQFYVVPLINGMIRAGDYDEKDVMFRAFIETDEMFKYRSRSEDEIDEDIYTRVARLASNAKSKQDRNKNKGITKIIGEIERRGQQNNKVIFANVTSMIDSTLTGVTAANIADRYKRPCVLLRRIANTAKDEIIYAGSGRNVDNSPVPNFKDILNELGLFDFVQGHQSAFGCQIKKENIPKAIELVNEKLSNVDFTTCIEADFILDEENLTIGLVKDIYDMRQYFGTGFPEPVIVIEKLCVRKDQFSIIGKEKNTWKVITDEGVQIIKFKIKEDDELRRALEEFDEAIITVAGRASINNYKGILTSQIVVVDYEMVGER